MAFKIGDQYYSPRYRVLMDVNEHNVRWVDTPLNRALMSAYRRGYANYSTGESYAYRRSDYREAYAAGVRAARQEAERNGNDTKSSG